MAKKTGHTVKFSIVVENAKGKRISRLRQDWDGWDKKGANETVAGLVDAIMRKVGAAAGIDVDKLPGKSGKK